MAVGRTVIFNTDVAINQDLKAIFPNPDLLEKDYLFHALVASEQNLSSKGTGSTVKGIRLEDLEKLPIAIPPLPEQKKIAEILSSFEYKIKKQKEITNKYKLLYKGYLEENFKILNDFKSLSLGEVANIIDPHPSHRAPKEVVDGIKFLGIGDFSEDGEIISNKTRVVSKDVLDQHKKKYQISEGLIGFCRVATVGKVINFKNFYSEEFALSPTMAVIKTTNINRSFLIHCLRSKNVESQINLLTNGSTRQSLGIQILRQIKIPNPPTDQQIKISHQLDNLLKIIYQLEKYISSLMKLKSGLSQDLLSGRKRVNV